MITAKITKTEVRCGRCGHLLMRVVTLSTDGRFEIKCHSCKEINAIEPHNEAQALNISDIKPEAIMASI